MQPGVFPTGKILDRACYSSPKVTQLPQPRQLATVTKPTAPSVSTLPGTRRATLLSGSTMQQKRVPEGPRHLLPVGPFRGFGSLVLGREFPPKCWGKNLLFRQLNWVTALLLSVRAPHLPPPLMVFCSFPTPVFHGSACNESFLHLSNTKAGGELEMKA